MKKRLSLLMALMMVLSLVPMSAFAATQLVTTDDKAVPVTMTFNLGSNANVATGKTIGFRLSNGAEFVTTPSITLSGAAGDGSLSTVSWNSSAGYLATVDTVGTTNIVPNGGDLKIQVSGTVNFEDVTFENSDSGDVTLTAELVSISYGDIVEKIATVQPATTKDLSVVVKDDEKKISEDGGKLSQFEINNIDANVTTISVELPKGVDFVAAPYANYGGTVSSTTTNSNLLTVVKSAADMTKLILTPEVVVTGNNVTNGAIEANIKAYKTDGTVEEFIVTIGQLVDYEVSMKIVENGKKEIPTMIGGLEKKTVQVTISGVKGSIDSNRKIDFTVDGAAVIANSFTTKSGLNAPTVTTEAGIGGFGDIVEDGEFSVQPTSDSKVEFTMDIVGNFDADGMATITAEQRNWELTSDLAEVTPAFTVETKITEVKKGESKATADVVITEAKAGLLKSGTILSLSLDAKRGGEFYDKNVEVTGTNKMTFKSPKLNTTGKILSFEVDKASYKEPAVITISDIVVAVDGNAIDGTYTLAFNHKGEEVKEMDYFTVVKEYSTTAATSVFTIGSKNYTVNGEAKTAVEAPYVQAGRTMLPIRAVAESLGLKVDYNSVTKQITFTNDTKVATLVVGADTMYVNGSPVKLSVASTLKSDTTFVELRSLATAFGVSIEWDAATKTVTING